MTLLERWDSEDDFSLLDGLFWDKSQLLLLTCLAASQPTPLLPLSPPHQVAIRRRPRLYVINLLVPSSFLVAIHALSFYLPAESESRAPFKITLLLGYNVFLLMMNDLLPTNGTPLISMAHPTFQGSKGSRGQGGEPGEPAASPLKGERGSVERFNLGKEAEEKCRNELP